MRGLMLRLFVGLWLMSGCTFTNDFDFTFAPKGDAGMSGHGDGNGDGKDDDPGGGDNGDGPDGGTGSGKPDAGPTEDPLCEAAKEFCSSVAECKVQNGEAKCTCPRGYFDMNQDGTECADLNECKGGPGAYSCPENSTCVNTKGGYDCQCTAGFIWNEASGECLDTCFVLLSTKCDADVGLCIKPDGEATCRCPSGYMDINGDGTKCEPDLVCMALECDPIAHCDGRDPEPKCECPRGFEGDGKTCLDINECALGIHDCDDNAQCTNTDGGFICTCKIGFEGDGKNCTDINECRTGEATCSENATCKNTSGGFECTCKSGFEGDGNSCTDINECALGTADCSPNAVCVNKPGTYSCECKPGYAGNGKTCENIDECAAGIANCDPTEKCVDTPGSYTCGCDAGYRKNAQGKCVDINECTEGLANCSVNATCTNTPGSFTCKCKAGYEGDGVSCTDINECVKGGHDCDTDPAACYNTPGGFECRCPSGYEGNGKGANGCTDINECQTGQNDCDALPNACVNTTGSYKCVCPPGYPDSDGDGKGCCTPQTGRSDETHPNDGVDNECDGFIDRPVIDFAKTFPEVGGATIAAHVSITVNPSIIKGAVLQCRHYKRTATPPAFADCTNPVTNPANGRLETNNGAWRTDLRWRYTQGSYNGAFSNVTSFDYYLHNSIGGDAYVRSGAAPTPKCKPFAVSDEEIFSFADTYLRASEVGKGYTDPGPFSPNTTFVTNPFISIGFTPLTGGFFSVQGKWFDVPEKGAYTANILSLRHRFILGMNNRYVLIRRAYPSRRGYDTHGNDDCYAARFRLANQQFSENHKHFNITCDAVVVNRAGAGLCLRIVNRTISVVAPQNVKVPRLSDYGYREANKYMWRMLMDEKGWDVNVLGEGPSTVTGFRNFSEKCDTANCKDNEFELYLPDRKVLRP